jgi:AraC family transcriptional regulator
LIIFLLNLSGCGKKAEEEKPYRIMIKTEEKMTIVYLEHMGPYNQMGELFARLGKYGAQKQLTGQMVGIYYDDPQVVPTASLRSEVGMVVPEGFEPDSGYKVKELPEQKVVYAVIKGPYAETANEYPYIYRWIEEKGYKTNGPVREIYLKADPDVPADQLKTEVQIPITE